MIQYILYSYVRVEEHNVSQNEQTTLTSILRALIFLKNSTLYTCKSSDILKKYNTLRIHMYKVYLLHHKVN